VTLEEARKRSSALEVASYDVALDLGRGTEKFWSRSQVSFRCRRDDVVAFADLQAVSIQQMALNGRRLDVRRVHDGRVDLPTLAGENTLVVEAEFGYASAAEGLNHVANGADGSICVYSKTNEGGAPRVFCCFDQPDLRAPFTVSVRAPAGWSCVANGPVVSRPSDGRGRWRFASTTPLAPYQFSVCAGSFHGMSFVCERTRGSALPVTIWEMPGGRTLLQAEVVLELLQQPLRYFEGTLRVPYPYGKCDLVFVPRFPALAFSAPGLIAIHDAVLKDGEGKPPALHPAMVIAHELAHAWIGGLADVRGYDEMWLQEAIATYLSRTALSEIRSNSSPWAASASAILPDHGYAEDADKIRQLEELIGREGVMLGLGTLLRRHAHGTATKDDLVRCWSEASGRDLSAWAAQTLVRANGACNHARAADAKP
jgi:aminopeptidase N